MLKMMLITVLSVSLLCSNVVYAESISLNDKPKKDSEELIFQDMLMLFLMPHMQEKIDEIYASLLTQSPDIYPYFVDVEAVKRVNGFRRFHFLITLKVVPTVGPHIAVGEDRLTFDISPVNPDNVKLVSWKHIKDPKKSDFPPNYQDLLKQPNGGM